MEINYMNNKYDNNYFENNNRNNNYNENFDTLQKARKDLMGEIEAVIEYDNHIHSTNDRLAKETWENIKSEELTHIGELLALLNHLDPSQQKYVKNGIKEFNERMYRQ